MIQKIRKKYPEEEGVGNVKKIVRRVKGGDKTSEEKKKEGGKEREEVTYLKFEPTTFSFKNSRLQPLATDTSISKFTPKYVLCRRQIVRH